MENQYLATVIQGYVIESAIKAVDAVPEYREVTEDGSEGKIIQVAIPAVVGKKAVMGKRVDKVFLENDEDTVARNLEDPNCNIKYYLINAKPTSCSISSVKISENRKTAPARETVELVVGSKVVAEAVV